MKNLLTPIKKAARASAGTPEIARGLATRSRHTKNSLRTAFGKTLDVTPIKGVSPGKRKSPSKLSPNVSPSKMQKSDRIRMKKKAVATLATLEKKSRKKSLFSSDLTDEPPQKKVTFSSDVDVVVMDTLACSCNLLECIACNPTKPDLDVAMTTNSDAKNGTHFGEMQSAVYKSESVFNYNNQEAEDNIDINDAENEKKELFIENEMVLANSGNSPSSDKNKKAFFIKNTNETILIDDENNNVGLLKGEIAHKSPKRINSNLIAPGCFKSKPQNRETTDLCNVSNKQILSGISMPQHRQDNENGNLIFEKDCKDEESSFSPASSDKMNISSAKTVVTTSMHVKCTNFPIRASTCIVPKPSPPYSLIKAMRRLERELNSPSKPCNHSICYHSNSCCHSTDSSNNNTLNSCHGNSSVASSNKCSHINLECSDNNNNTNCQGSFKDIQGQVDNNYQYGLDNVNHKTSDSRTLYPLPPSIMSTYVQ